MPALKKEMAKANNECKKSELSYIPDPETEA